MSVKQFDIIYIDLNPTRGREKQNIRPCLVINNQIMIDGTEFVWVVPIINRELRYPTDIELKTKKRTGIWRDRYDSNTCFRFKRSPT